MIAAFGLVALAATANPHPATPDTTGALALIAAGIEEVGVEIGRVPDRAVRLWIEVDELPACPSAGQDVRYGFLIDADRERATGLAPPALDIGVDARITAVCRNGEWRSPVGEVDVARAAAGPDRIEIRTTVDRLPSIEFLWIAYARMGNRVVGLPAPRPAGDGQPGHSAWAILERSRP